MKKTILLLFGIILWGVTSPLLAQSRFSYGLKASYVLNGVFQNDPLENNLQSNVVLPGPSFTLGMSHSYFLNKKQSFSINIGMLYEHSGFTRLKIVELNSGNLLKNKEQYRKQSILMPLDFRYQYKKFSCSIGIVYTSLLSINLKEKYCYDVSGNCDYKVSNQINFQINENGEASSMPFSGTDVSYIDDRENLQYSLGFFYLINNNFEVGMEYRNFIFENLLHSIRIGSDTIQQKTFHQQTNAIDLSIRYLIR